jgi:L-lactate dehydrogenase
MTVPGKITIVGAGHVGSHCAMALAWAGVAAEVVLYDQDGDKARSQAWDVSDALSFPSSGMRVRAGGPEDCADAEILVVAIGEPRLPGQTRLDLLDRSVVMVGELLETLGRWTPQGLVITITNPADIVADYLRRGLGLDRSRVFGTGTLLDTARLVRLLSDQSGVARCDIQAWVLGEHGDSSMVPFSQVTLGGRPFGAFPSLDSQTLLAQTRQTGMDIVIGKGSTEFGIGQSLAALCGAILRDERRVFPLSAALEGEYGQRGLHAGVPCLVGRTGIETVVELPLTPEEQSQWEASCRVIHSHIQRAQDLAPLNKIPRFTGVLHA